MKIKGAIIILITAIIVVFTLLSCGCFEEKKETKASNEIEQKLIQIYHSPNYGYRIVYDKDTMVEYIIYGSQYPSITPRYNSDGSVAIYQGEAE